MCQIEFFIGSFLGMTLLFINIINHIYVTDNNSVLSVLVILKVLLIKFQIYPSHEDINICIKTLFHVKFVTVKYKSIFFELISN